MYSLRSSASWPALTRFSSPSTSSRAWRLDRMWRSQAARAAEREQTHTIHEPPEGIAIRDQYFMHVSPAGHGSWTGCGDPKRRGQLSASKKTNS
eukprot:scaffold239796_cov23-Tisochrysis_lutea.AAC.2